MTYLISVILAVIIGFCIPEDFPLIGQIAIGISIGMNSWFGWYSLTKRD